MTAFLAVILSQQSSHASYWAFQIQGFNCNSEGEGKDASDDAPVGELTRKAAADDRPEGGSSAERSTYDPRTAGNCNGIQRCSLGVAEKLEEVNNIAAAAAGPLSPVFLGGKATHGVRAGRGRVRF